jgi:hypothetical protein
MESERTSLSPSGWRDWTFDTASRAKMSLAACVPLPLVVLGLALHWEWLTTLGVILIGVAQLLAIRGERDAYFTATHVHRRLVLLGLAVEDVPLHEVDDVSVEPIPLYPEWGNVVVECRLKRLRFEFVPDARIKAARLRGLAETARGLRRETRTSDGVRTG